MALDIPLVPVNSDAKTFAAQSLTQAINNMHLAAAGAGATAQPSAADKRSADSADLEAWMKELDRRGLVGGKAPVDGAAPSAAAPSAAVTPASPGVGTVVGAGSGPVIGEGGDLGNTSFIGDINLSGFSGA